MHYQLKNNRKVLCINKKRTTFAVEKFQNSSTTTIPLVMFCGFNR